MGELIPMCFLSIAPIVYGILQSTLLWNCWISKTTSILVLGDFIKRLDFSRRVLQNSFTIWETADLPRPRTLETNLYEFPVDNHHEAQAARFWMLRKYVYSFLMSASNKLTVKSNVDGSILNSFFQKQLPRGIL